MNTANLQLEGLFLAVAAVHRAIVDKGVLTAEEIDKALHSAEVQAMGDDCVEDEMSPANRDAVCFPIRLLRVANRTQDPAKRSFSELAKTVGRTKQSYNDQA